MNLKQRCHTKKKLLKKCHYGNEGFHESLQRTALPFSAKTEFHYANEGLYSSWYLQRTALPLNANEGRESLQRTALPFIDDILGKNRVPLCK